MSLYQKTPPPKAKELYQRIRDMGKDQEADAWQALAEARLWELK